MTHYTARMRNELAAETRRREKLEEGIRELRRYLQSTKFFEDTTVQVGDVLLRLEEAESYSVRED